MGSVAMSGANQPLSRSWRTGASREPVWVKIVSPIFRGFLGSRLAMLFTATLYLWNAAIELIRCARAGTTAPSGGTIAGEEKTGPV